MSEAIECLVQRSRQGRSRDDFHDRREDVCRDQDRGRGIHVAYVVPRRRQDARTPLNLEVAGDELDDLLRCLRARDQTVGCNGIRELGIQRWDAVLKLRLWRTRGWREEGPE